MAPGKARHRWWLPPLGWAAIGALVAQTAVLRVLRVPLGLQVAVLVTAVWATLAGAGFLRSVTAGIGDVGARFAIWYLAGMAAITGVAYVLLHPPVARALGLHGPAAAAGLSLCLVGLAALVVAFLRHPEEPAPASGWGMSNVPILVLALVLSGATVYGVANTTAVDPTWYEGSSILEDLDPEHPLVGSTLPEWGYRGDFYFHLISQPALIQSSGLPAEPISHQGLQVWLLTSSLAIDGFDVADPVQAAKVLAVSMWFSLLALARFLARRVLGVGRVASMGAVAAVALFAAINYPVLGTSRSSYLGFISASGAMYHNLPQLYSVALGMAAAVLIGASAEQGRPWGRPFVVAAAFVSASFWFKPSLFVVMAPAMVIAAGLVWREHRRAALGAILVLCFPPLWWVAYPRLVGVPTLDLGMGIDPFDVYFGLGAGRFPAWISSSFWRQAIAIVVLSFAAWLTPLGAWLGRAGSALRRRGRAALGVARRSALQVVLAVALALGVAMGVLLAEPGQARYYGNFTWSASAAYVISLPLLVRLATDVRSRVCRWVIVALFALHVAAGGLHLWILVTAGHI